MLFGTQMVVHVVLTRKIDQVLIPELQEDTGYLLGFRRIRVNIAEAKLTLHEVTLRNHKAESLISAETVHLRWAWSSWLPGTPLELDQVVVAGGVIQIIRRADGGYNFEEAKVTVTDVNPVRPHDDVLQPKPVAEQKKEPLDWAEVVVHQLVGGVQIRYWDQHADQESYLLNLQVRGSQLSTLKGTDASWGRLQVSGAMERAPSSCKTELNLRVAPIRDPKKVSFDLSGKITAVDPALLDSLYRELDIQTGPVGIEPQLRCREGTFERSLLWLDLTDIEIGERLSTQLGGMKKLGALRFPLPLEGPVNKPRVSADKALESIMQGSFGDLFQSFFSI